MKAFIPTVCLTLIAYGCFAQQKLIFSYDTAGNQILRDRVCGTCGKENSVKILDSLIASDFSEKLDETDVYNIRAFPNPVKHILNLELEGQSAFHFNTIQLFTMDGKMILDLSLGKPQQRYQLYLDKYPHGLYLVKIRASDGESRIFKIIKS